MLYSVYNPATKLYDYYQSSESSPLTHVGAPPQTLLASSLGASPEQGAWKVPMGAKKVGSGELPKGKVATRSSMIPFAGLDLVGDATVLYVAGALAAYFWWRNRR